MNLSLYLDSTVERYPEKTALIYRDRSWTYREFHERVCKAAGMLGRLGAHAGDSVAIISANCNAYIELLFACNRQGLIYEQHNVRLSKTVMLALLSQSDCSIIVLDHHNAQLQTFLEEGLQRDVDFIIISEPGFEPDARLDYEELLKKEPAYLAAVPIDDEDICVAQFTSGTTGIPKKVLLTNQGFLAVSFATIAETGWGKDDTYLQSLPLFHGSSHAGYTVFLHGGTLVVTNCHFDAESCIDVLARHRITCMGIVPYMLKKLLDQPDFTKERLADLNTILYGGAPITRIMVEQCTQRLSLRVMGFYGMTEMSSLIAVLNVEGHEKALARPADEPFPVGVPVGGVRLKIVDQDDRVCAPYEMGEIVAYGDGRMGGYSDPVITKQVLRDGWYYTGDIGYRDDEGYYYLVDRKDDMLISGGENIYPSDIEDTIRSISSDVVDVVVVGLPDEAWGQIVAAAIIRKEGSDITEEFIIEEFRSHYDSYKKPKAIRFVDDFPRTANGKIDRKCVVRELFA